MKVTAVFIFGVSLLISFLILAGLWHLQMEGAYFVGHRSVPGDFIPPFINSGGQGNFYIKPLRVIYAIWFLYVAVTIGVPFAITWLLIRLRQRALDNSSWR